MDNQLKTIQAQLVSDVQSFQQLLSVIHVSLLFRLVQKRAWRRIGDGSIITQDQDPGSYRFGNLRSEPQQFVPNFDYSQGPIQ